MEARHDPPTPNPAVVKLLLVLVRKFASVVLHRLRLGRRRRRWSVGRRPDPLGIPQRRIARPRHACRGTVQLPLPTDVGRSARQRGPAPVDAERLHGLSVPEPLLGEPRVHHGCGTIPRHVRGRDGPRPANGVAAGRERLRVPPDAVAAVDGRLRHLGRSAGDQYPQPCPRGVAVAPEPYDPAGAGRVGNRRQNHLRPDGRIGAGLLSQRTALAAAPGPGGRIPELLEATRELEGAQNEAQSVEETRIAPPDVESGPALLPPHLLARSHVPPHQHPHDRLDQSIPGVEPLVERERRWELDGRFGQRVEPAGGTHDPPDHPPGQRHGGREPAESGGHHVEEDAGVEEEIQQRHERRSVSHGGGLTGRVSRGYRHHHYDHRYHYHHYHHYHHYRHYQPLPTTTTITTTTAATNHFTSLHCLHCISMTFSFPPPSRDRGAA